MRAADRIADPDLRIERITVLPIDLGDLIRLSLRDDFRALQRMREDWVSGSNRFDRPGEALFEARVGSRLIGSRWTQPRPLHASAQGRESSTSLRPP